MQTTKINPKFPNFFLARIPSSSSYKFLRVVYIVSTKTLMQTKLIKKTQRKNNHIKVVVILTRFDQSRLYFQMIKNIFIIS